MFKPVETFTCNTTPDEVHRTIRRHLIRQWRNIVGIYFYIYCTIRRKYNHGGLSNIITNGGLASLDWNRKHEFPDSVSPILILLPDTELDMVVPPKVPYEVTLIEEIARENYDLFKDRHERDVDIDIDMLDDEEIGYLDYNGRRYIYIKDMSIDRAMFFLARTK